MSRKWSKAIALMVSMIIVVGFISMLAENPKKNNPLVTDSYKRPKPTRPIKPEMPSKNRNTKTEVFLEKADSLFANPEGFGERKKQIVKGEVAFRQAGATLYCDSAYYYPEENSMDAFGNVRMQQGDTLFIYADKIFYDGNAKRASLKSGPSQQKVKLVNRNVTLTTDTLDYDFVRKIGWYDHGGTLNDKVNTLSSLHGDYSPATKQAHFNGNVVLQNHQEGYTMNTDILDYSTATHIAEIHTPTHVKGKNEEIFTDNATYNTNTHVAQIYAPSVIIGTKETIYTSAGWYNTQTHHAQIEAPTHIVGEKEEIFTTNGWYNTKTHHAQIESPSRIWTDDDEILTERGWYNTATGLAELQVRSTINHLDSARNLIVLVGDSMTYDRDKSLSRAYSFRDPELRQPVILTDTARKVVLTSGYGEYDGKARMATATYYPLLVEYSRPDTLFLRADTIRSIVETRLIFPDEVVQNAETDSTGNILPLDSALMVNKDYHIAKAFHRARFFNQQAQGIADSLTYVEFDSIMYLHGKPIVWSGERQVNGNVINVHFNDSTVDWALLPEHGIAAERADEDFFTQLSAKWMKAFFADEKLTHLDADGNVTTIVLPMEKDSTYNKLIYAESSYLTVDLEGDDIEKIKMWPDVSGTVTPLFMVKPNQKYLPGFKWYEAIRPKRVWYGDRWHWDDDMGEVYGELEEYFNDTSGTGLSKKF